ncbi:hypothetical protein RE92_25185 (plasmid) [Paenibacillus polymyxa]|nr:hypothetical protein RE92_25185 [Paenibacillus polymyxa]
MKLFEEISFKILKPIPPFGKTIKREHHDAGWLKELFGKHKQRIFLKVRPNLIFNVRWICSENHIYS